MQKNIAIIGSTGSIGKQTLEVIKAHRSLFRPYAIACHGNTGLLEKQICEFRPAMAVVYDRKKATELKKKIRKNPRINTIILSGGQGLKRIATDAETDKVVFASSGTKALGALLEAIKMRKGIALANKELLVSAGDLVMSLARKYKVKIIPIDSEHSAVFQCIQGEDPKNIEKIILTCSGGPFYGMQKNKLANISALEALRHPVWKMGREITLDSATLMNKAFEIIEAKHLFGLKVEQIEVVIHPEGIIHSLVQFKDGSVKAQISCPDMRLPITYALSYPNRVKTHWPRIDLAKISKLTFLKPDFSIFEGPELAYKAAKEGGNRPAALLRANRAAAKAFLRGEITFDRIYPALKKELGKIKPAGHAGGREIRKIFR